jgi:3-oxoacyl-[acyl-carrier protein] reductase
MGRTAIVTGVSRGIGYATAKALIARGDRVIGLARTSPEGLDIEFHATDLSVPASIAATMAKVAPAGVDILVNNAGYSVPASIEETSVDDLQRQSDINVRATLLCAQAVLPHMRAQGYGRIVNISSRSALGKPRLTAYGATKAAVIGLTRGWALELAREGVTVNCICPGPIETDMFAQNFPPGTPGREGILKEVAMRRAGKPEEVAAAVAYFASPEAGFTTGQVLYVCGGATVGFAGM